MAYSLTRNYSNYTSTRLELHAWALTRIISLGYRGISLSFHAISLSYVLFHFPMRFLLYRDYTHTIFLNGQFMRPLLLKCTINFLYKYITWPPLLSELILYQVTGCYWFGSVWWCVQGYVEYWSRWTRPGSENLEVWVFWWRLCQVPARGSHHGPIQPQQCSQAVWCSHSGKTSKWMQTLF